MKRSLELVGLGLFICLAPGGLARGQVAISVSPSLPSDIAGAPRRLHCSKRRPSRGKSSSHSIGPQWRASAMLPTQVRNSARAAARWSGRRSAAKSKSSILPRTARLPATPRRRRTWATTLRRLIFTEPNQCQLVLDRSCPPRQPKDDPGLAGLPSAGRSVSTSATSRSRLTSSRSISLHTWRLPVTIRRTGSGIRHGSITSWFQSRPRRSTSPQSRQPIPSTVRPRSSRPTLSSRQIIRCSDSRAPSPVRARRPRLACRRLTSSHRQQLRRPLSSVSIWAAVWAATATRKSAALILASSWRGVPYGDSGAPPPCPKRRPRSAMPQCATDI